MVSAELLVIKYCACESPSNTIRSAVFHASHESITTSDLLELPIICSKQLLTNTLSKNDVNNWFGKAISDFNIVATYNLIFNAAILVR